MLQTQVSGSVSSNWFQVRACYRSKPTSIRRITKGIVIRNLPIETESPIDDEDGSVDSFLAAGIVQQLTRTSVDGTEQIHGVFRCVFQPDQDRLALQIPIHPPLAEIPDVESFAIEREARIRVTDREKFGIRLEIVPNQSTASEPIVFIEVIISAKA